MKYILFALFVIYICLFTTYVIFLHCDSIMKKKKIALRQNDMKLKRDFHTQIVPIKYGHSNKTAWTLTNVCLQKRNDYQTTVIDDFLFSLGLFKFNDSVATFLPSRNTGKMETGLNIVFFINTYEYPMNNVHHFFKDLIIDFYSILIKMHVPITTRKRFAQNYLTYFYFSDIFINLYLTV